MEQTLKQVGELLLGAIPTSLLLLLLYAVYHFLVHRPLVRILDERRARTLGAIEKARADVAAAEAKAIEYEARLREARLAIFKSQELRRHQAQQTRGEAVAQARARADEQVKQARQQLQQEVATARTSLQADSEQLAAAIIKSILQPAGAGHAPAAGGQS